MILRHLRYFSAAAEHGSMVAAARKLRVAQPSLSRQISALERQIGVTLFDRTRRGIRLTPSGSALYSAERAINDRLEHALIRTRMAHEGRLGTIRLGLSRGALESSRIGQAVAALRRRLPEVQLEVTEVGSFSHAEALLAGDVDLAIGLHAATEHPRGIRREAFFSEPVECVLLSAAHALAGAASIRPAQLRSERLLMIDPAISRGFPEMYDALRGLHAGGPFETYETVDSVYSLVAAGRGWAPAITALRDHPPPGTAVVPLEGLHVDLVMGVSWRATDRSRLVSNVLQVLRDECVTRACQPATAEGESPSDDANVVSVPRGLELRHLRALIVTIAEGAVGRAATRLGLTTSGLSRQLRTLEQDIGTPLFTRGPAGTAPTAAGQVFRTEAVAVVAMIDDAFAQARATQRGPARSCRIGTVPGELAGDLVLDVVRYMEQLFPDVAIEITGMLTSLQVPALRTRRIDVGVAAAYPGLVGDPNVASVRIGDDAVECALLSTSHPLATRSRLQPTDLTDIPFLFIARATYPRLYDTVMAAFDQIGLVARVEGSFNGPRAVWRLAAESMGWTVGSRVLRANPPAGLVAIPIEGLRIPTGIELLWRRDEDDPSIKAVLDAFRCSGGLTEGLARDPSADAAQKAAALSAAPAFRVY